MVEVITLDTAASARAKGTFLSVPRWPPLLLMM